MTSHIDQAGTTVFVPSVVRFMISELWPYTLYITGGAVLMYLLGSWEWQEVGSGAGLGLVLIVFGAVFMRQNRRVAFGDTWVTGPTGSGSDSATIPFNILDVAQSGFRKRRFRVASQSGEQISARLAWYSSADVEGMKLLARERCGIMALPDDGV